MIINLKIDQSSNRLALKYLSNEISNIIIENKEINNIVSNGNICAVLQDDLKYALSPRNDINYNDLLFPIGEFDNVNMYIDSLQKWSDNRIFFKNDIDIIAEIQIEDENSILI